MCARYALWECSQGSILTLDFLTLEQMLTMYNIKLDLAIAELQTCMPARSSRACLSQREAMYVHNVEVESHCRLIRLYFFYSHNVSGFL